MRCMIVLHGCGKVKQTHRIAGAATPPHSWCGYPRRKSLISLGFALCPFYDLLHRSERLRRANSLDRCAPWPVPPWTTLRPVDGGDNAARCPLTAHRPLTRCPPLHCTGGHAPRNPPPCIRTAHLFEISLKQPNSPPAFGLRGFALPSSWSAEGWGEPRRPFRPCGGRACPPQGGRGNLPPPRSRPRRRAGRRKRSAQPTEGWAKGGRIRPPLGG